MKNNPPRKALSDYVTSFCGSWYFITLQTVGFSGWIFINSYHIVNIDPPPYMGLNLVLSFLAAYTAPFIMISQNKEQQKDRKTITENLRLETRTEKEVAEIKETLHKIMKSTHKHT